MTLYVIFLAETVIHPAEIVINPAETRHAQRVDHNPPIRWTPASQFSYGVLMNTRSLIHQLVREAHPLRQCYVPRSNTESATACRMLADRELVSPYYGMYADPPYWSALDPRSRIEHICRTLCRKHPGIVIAGISAAAVWGLDHSTYLHRDGTIHVAKSYGVTAKNKSPRLHYIHLPKHRSDLITTHNGIQLTNPTRTLFDCGRTQEFNGAFPIFESALRIEMVGKNAFLDYCAQPYVGHDRHLPAFVMDKARGLSENGGESFALAVIFELGFLWPEQQVEFICVGPSGRQEVRRVDFAWYTADGRIIVGELDGQQKYVDPSMTGGRSISEIVEDERLRSQMLRNSGVTTIVRFTFDDVVRRTPLAKKLREAGVPYTNPPLLPQSHKRASRISRQRFSS